MQRQRIPPGQFLLKYGQFRSQAPFLENTRTFWSQARRNGRTLFESSEWRELKALFSEGTDRITLIATDDFWQEWYLLEIIAEIAGNLARGTNPILFKSEVDRALKILNDLENRFQLIAATLSGQIRFTYKEVIEASHRLAVNNSNAKRRTTKFNEELRANLSHVVLRAMNRAMGLMPEVHFRTSGDGSPGFYARIDSILGHAYLCVLANFAQNWIRCRRPDCQNLFLASGKRTKCCTWNCGHIESVRRARRRAGRR